MTLLQEGPVVESLKARFEFMEEQGYFRLRHVKRRQGDEYFKVSVVLLWSFLVCLAGVWTMETLRYTIKSLNTLQG